MIDTLIQSLNNSIIYKEQRVIGYIIIQIIVYLNKEEAAYVCNI